jgi:hypothetical protein
VPLNLSILFTNFVDHTVCYNWKSNYLLFNNKASYTHINPRKFPQLESSLAFLFLLVLSQMNPVYSMPPLPFQRLRFILTWTFGLHLRLQSVLLPSQIHTKVLYGFLFSPSRATCFRYFRHSQFYHPNVSWWGVQTMKLLSM